MQEKTKLLSFISIGAVTGLPAAFIYLIVYLFFYKLGHNYAEVGVLQLYTFALLFFINLHSPFKIYLAAFTNSYIELPAIIFYTAITKINFFNKDNKLVVLIKSIAATSMCFVTASIIQDMLIKIF